MALFYQANYFTDTFVLSLQPDIPVVLDANFRRVVMRNADRIRGDDRMVDALMRGRTVYLFARLGSDGTLLPNGPGTPGLSLIRLAAAISTLVGRDVEWDTDIELRGAWSTQSTPSRGYVTTSGGKKVRNSDVTPEWQTFMGIRQDIVDKVAGDTTNPSPGLSMQVKRAMSAIGGGESELDEIFSNIYLFSTVAHAGTGVTAFRLTPGFRSG